MFRRIAHVGIAVAGGSCGMSYSCCSHSTSVADMRQEYSKSSLNEEELTADPMELFSLWMNEAVQAKVLEPNAMCLSTCFANKPSARMVLLKFYDEKGFLFFTNYDSRKGLDLEKNPHAALTFWWGNMERSIRIEGVVSKISEAESEKYFHQRPVGSQLGAWASDQSHRISDRKSLDKQYEVISRKLLNLQEVNEWKELPKPPNWGGYRLVPTRIEFWMGRPSRLHDRIVYEKLSAPLSRAMCTTRSECHNDIDCVGGNSDDSVDVNCKGTHTWLMSRLQP